MEILNRINYISQLLFKAYGLPVQFSDKENVLVHEYDSLLNPVYSTPEDFLSSFINENDPYNEPIIKVTRFMEYLVVLRIANDEQLIGNLVIGPALMSTITNDMISGLAEDYSIPIYFKQSLFDYYKQLKILAQRDIQHVAQLAYYLIYNKELSNSDNILNSVSSIASNTTITQQLQSRRLETSFHMDQRQEQFIWQCIKEGNKEKLLLHLNQLKVEGVGLLSKRSHIRHIKNSAIIAIALATRASVEGGLYPEIAYTMSDVYIQQVEDSNDTNQINLSVNKFFFQLIDRLNSTKSSNQSKHIILCKNYIFNHIFEKITIQQLAKLVHLNPTYLSQTFKKETGVSLGKYILNEKLNEAKRMLVQSDVSIAEISMLLQFSDQSYFTSAFKKYTGLTPRQYRNNPEFTD